MTLSAEADLLRIADDGPGISAGNRNRVFAPFFPTRRDTGGTAWACPSCDRVLEAHGAEITLAEGPGAVFEIRF